MSTTDQKSYRPGSWFGIFGERATVLLPPSEKSRVAALWELVDDGADFGEVLDALIASGLRDLPGFVLVSDTDGTTKVVLRGPVEAVFTTVDGETVQVDGSAASTWVERSISGVESMRVSLEDADGGAHLTISGGLVRVGQVDEPPYVEPPVDLPLDVPVEAAVQSPLDVPVEEVPDVPVEAAPDVPDEELEAAPELPVEEVPDVPVEAAPELPVDEPVVVAEEPDSVGFFAFAPDAPAPLAPDVVPEPPSADPVSADPRSDDTEVFEMPAAADWGQSEAGAAAGAPLAPPLPPGPPAWGEPPVEKPAVEAPPVNPWASAPVPPPSAPPAPPAPEGGQLGGPDPDDHDGMTRAGDWDPNQFARQRPGIPGQPPAPNVTTRPVARLSFSSGETIDVDRAILVGRAPEARRFSSTDQPRLVTVPSPNQEISSTHLEVRPGSGVDHGSAIVTDMGSTNGTVLVQPGLAPEDLQPGIPVQLIPGAIVDLGDGVTISVTNP